MRTARRDKQVKITSQRLIESLPLRIRNAPKQSKPIFEKLEVNLCWGISAIFRLSGC